MKKSKLLNLLIAGSIALSGLTGFSSAVSAQTERQDIVNIANKYIGYQITNYNSADFVSYVYKKEGINLSSSIYGLRQEGVLIQNQNELQAGDILFFGTSPKNLLASGIYLGDRKFIIAYKPYKKIKVLNLDSSIAQKYYLGARRVINHQPETPINVPSKTPNNKPNDQNNTPGNQPFDSKNFSQIRQNIINAGMKYLGTPYEYGSSRSDTSTFDCSDFVRQAFKDGAGIVLPTNSRTQAAYVKQKGNYTTDWRKLKPGDIMFFMSYRGYKPSDYKGIDPSTQRITHNGIYLGDGKVLHTYSQESGGVRIDTIEGKHWESRFIFGGSAL
ncbi:C40 family peptidase [Microaerobacter geothermalis]|uniref:C40 family peptidase n=1 Tax=Microaerobacter geothermalis TaxID=674972 RepID=UPI001F175108|nr:C40 family peptidase [Microaerobacter geothermalis]MCF6095010.1 C40 family peptidase [Microaerobacter geothermalis]